MAAEMVHDDLRVSPRTRPPRSLNVVLNPTPEELGATIDWSAWYLTDEEDMGESCEQEQIIWIFKQILTELARERGWTNVHIGADQFFAWIESEPLVRVSPDVYLLDDPPSEPPLPAIWETWRDGHRPPRFAVEIVSGDRWQKDYQDNPPKYAQLGVSELLVFDPEAASGATSNPKRVALQVFRREGDGAFIKVAFGAGPVLCEEPGVFAVVQKKGKAARLSLSRDEQGLDLVHTTEQAREGAEQAREGAEHERHLEQAARKEAERKLERAMEELRRLKQNQ